MQEIIELLEGASSTRAEKKYEPENLVLPEDQTKSKLPQGMTVREYLLSPPKVDMEKFMQSKPKSAAARQNTFEQSYNNISTSEINSNIDKLKSSSTIQPSSYLQEENYDFTEEEPSRGNLTNIKPEEITNEAEEIIRQVAMQEKLERESSEDTDYIDYSDVEQSAHSETQNEEMQIEEEDSDFTFEEPKEEPQNSSSFDRDRKFSQEIDRSRSINLDRDRHFSMQNSEQTSDSQQPRENRFRPNDEIAKRKSLFSLMMIKPLKILSHINTQDRH